MTALLFAASFGCGTPVERSLGEPGANFPHPEGYATHGVESVADLESCVACHDVGTSERSAPGCQSCHDGYPHVADIARGSVHGEAWLASRSDCADCHGEAGARAPAEVETATCATCHHTFPHVASYVDQHGAEVVTRGGPAACASCHPAEGGRDEGRCVDCHAAYPHPDAWGATRAHDRQADESCTTCHEATGANRADVPVCTQCHDLYPHPVAEVWRSGHLEPVHVRGEVACRTCHLPGEPPGPGLPVSCAASCHGVGEAP